MRRQYRNFYEQHRGLLEGLVPYLRVGLVFSYQQLECGSRGHMEDTYRVAEELMAKHVLFDILVERNLRPGELEGYDLVIACDLENISDLQVQALLGYIEKGGTLLGVGEIGARDQRGQKRMGGALGSIPASSWEDGDEVETAPHGEGQCIRAPSLDRLLSPAPFELFMLSDRSVTMLTGYSS